MFFIVFEGLDGSGKSSLIQFLEKELIQRGKLFLRTREPGGTPLGEEIRELILKNQSHPPSIKAEALLYQASRAQHVDCVIRPALEKRKWVLCDRFSASSVAFQGAARRLGEKEIIQLNDFSTGGLTPHLTVLLDLPVDEAEQRRQRRYQETGEQPDRIENEAKNFHETVRQSFLRQANNSPQSWLVLNSLESSEQLWRRLSEHISSLGMWR